MRTPIAIYFFMFLIAGTLTSCALTKNEPDLPTSTYPPGPIGYLYEDCNKALNFTSIDDFQNSYCGTYTQGFFVGLMQANWILMSVSSGDMCNEDLLRTHHAIDNRFNPFGLKEKWPLEKDLKSLANPYLRYPFLYALWAEFLISTSNHAKLQMHQSEDLTEFLRDKDFQIYLLQNPEKAKELIERLNNSPFGKLVVNKKEYRDNNGFISRTNQEAYNQCKSDLEQYGASEESFEQSSCGTEIKGYLAGLLSTAPFIRDKKESFKNKPTWSPCDQKIFDLYDDLDVSKRFCISNQTKLRESAEKFLNHYNNTNQRMLKSEDVAPEDKDAFKRQQVPGSLMGHLLSCDDS